MPKTRRSRRTRRYWNMWITAFAVTSLMLLGATVFQEQEGGLEASNATTASAAATSTGGTNTPPAEPAEAAPERRVTRQDLIASLTIFVLAVFVGFEVITKVPPTLHTPLMSGSNAISGITLVGAVIVTANPAGEVASWLGCVAVTLATINVVGGFMVTHRMLAMFRR